MTIPTSASSPARARAGVRAALDPRRRPTTVAGTLVLVATAAGILSVVPVLETDDYLTAIPDHDSQVVSGALFQALMVPAYAGFALVLHPVLRVAAPSLSLGFVGFRLISCGFHLLAVAMLALLLDIGDAYAAAPEPALEVVAETVRVGRDLVNHVVVIVAMGLGDLLLFGLLLHHRLVPRWLAGWGAAGVGLAILASMLFLAGLLDVVGAGYLALNAPLALHGLVLATWLICRGLDGRRTDAV